MQSLRTYEKSRLGHRFPTPFCRPKGSSLSVSGHNLGADGTYCRHGWYLDCQIAVTPASPCGHLCKNASDLFAFVSDRPCGSSTTSTGRARVGENSLPLSPEPHAMRKRTDVAMIETLAWLRDLGLENGGTRCRSCARWRGRTSVRPSNPGGQKFLVPRRKLWVIQGMLVGSASPDGRVNCASAKRIAVKPCAFGAPLRGCGA